MRSFDAPRPNYGNSGPLSHINRSHAIELKKLVAKKEAETKKMQEGMDWYVAREQGPPPGGHLVLESVILAQAIN